MKVALRRRVALSLGCLVALWSAVPRPARAGNDDEVPIGDEAAMSGAAVTATVRSGNALYYNPAGLMGAPEDSIDLGASLLVVRRYRAPRLLASSGGLQGPSNVVEFVSVPSALSFVRAIGPKLRLGVGLFQVRSTDYLLRAQLVVDRAPGETTEWSVILDNSSTTYLGSVGIAFDLHPKVHFGVALHVAYGATGGALQFGGARYGPSGMADAFVDQALIGSYAAVGFGATVGVQAQVHERVRIGVSLMSPLVHIFEQTIESFTFTSAGTAEAPFGSPLFVGERIEDRRFSLDLAMPARLRGGVALTFDRGHVALDGDFQHGLERPELAIRRGGVWNLRAGTEWLLADRLFGGFGVFTDRSAERAVREFGDSRIHFYGFSAGLRYGKDRRLAEVEDVDALHFMTTLALRFANGRGNLGGLRVQDDIGAPGLVEVRPVPLTVRELGIHIGSELSF